jgi:hypothetical protein
MTEFELFKEEVKDYLKNNRNSGFNTDNNKELLIAINRFSHTSIHTETYKKLTKKINLLVMNSLFTNDDKTAIAYLIKIKKLGIPLRVRKDFMSKLNNFNSRTQNDIVKILKKTDLFLQAFSFDYKQKEELLNQYIARQQKEIKDAYLPKEIRDIKLELLEQYHFHREKRKLELLINDDDLSKTKVKNKVKI